MGRRKSVTHIFGNYDNIIDTNLSGMGRPAAKVIEPFSVHAIRRALVDGASIVAGELGVWSSTNANELAGLFVQTSQSETSGDELRPLLLAASRGARLLLADLQALNLLPLADYGAKRKRELIEAPLDGLLPSINFSPELEKTLSVGIFNGGTGFKTGRVARMRWLVLFAEYFLKYPQTDRATAMKSPLDFRTYVWAAPGDKEQAQRQAILYLAFPDYFLPIISVEQRRLIRDAFADEYLGRDPDDVDVDLHDIYEAVCESVGGPVDFYDEPWIDRWRRPKTTAATPTDQVQHAWRINGSNVAGQDMVPTWLKKSSASLAAKFLRPVEPDIAEDELKGFVEQDYRSSGYAARQAKVDEFYSFLARMHNNDLVVTVSQGLMRFGTVTGDAEYVKSSDGRSNLRRPIHWLPTVVPIDRAPDELVARLSAQDDVVDLTQQIDTLTELMERRDSGGHGRLHLPDADAQLADKLNVPQQWLQQCIELLRDRPQMIFYGPPGTGKTYIAQELGRHLASQANVKLVQFHPAYSYEDFFEGYRPDAQSAGQIGYQLKPGPLRRIVDLANENRDAVYVLIIDEINRGNIAKIFGELYFLLEYRDETIDLMYSSGAFQLPKNVVIIGTMNTADRSIALVDSAMRRRFAFRALHPTEPPTNGVLRSWLSKQGLPGDNADLLDALNNRIDDEEFKIGPSYFMRASVYKPGGLQLMWESSIIPLLEEFHFGDHDVDVQSMYGLDKLRKITQTDSASAVDEDASATDSV